jgi:hypothetical protein
MNSDNYFQKKNLMRVFHSVFLQHDSPKSREVVLNLIRDVIVPDLQQFLILFKGPPNFNSEKQTSKYLSYWTTRLEYLEYLCSADLFHRKDGVFSLLYLLLQFLLTSNSPFSEDIQEPFEDLLSVLHSISSHLSKSSDFEQYLLNLQELQTEVASMNLFLSDFEEVKLEILGCQKTLLLLSEIVQSFLSRNKSSLKQNLQNSLSLNYFMACQEQQKTSLSFSDSLEHSSSPSNSLFHFSLIFNQILIMELRHGRFLQDLIRNYQLPLMDSLPYQLLSLLDTTDTLSIQILEQALLEIKNTILYPSLLPPSSVFLHFLFITETLLRNGLPPHSLLDQPLSSLPSNPHYPNAFHPLLSDETLFPESSVYSFRLKSLLDSFSNLSPPLIGTPY